MIDFPASQASMNSNHDANDLMIQVASMGVDALPSNNDTWLRNQNKLEQLHELRVMALGNARILYGAERFKFYDVVVAYSEPDAKFAAILMCSANEATKILRKEVHDCPLAAARILVHGLHKDTGLLLCTQVLILSPHRPALILMAGKYTVGDTLRGPQGEKPRGGEFTLHNFKKAVNDLNEAEDDMRSLNRMDGAPHRGLRVDEFIAPRGPRLDRCVNKRLRMESMGCVMKRPTEHLSYENDRLNYDD